MKIINLFNYQHHELIQGKTDVAKGRKLEADIMLQQLDVTQMNNMKNFMGTAHALALDARPFSDFTWLCAMVEGKGIAPGSQDRNDKRCQEMIQAIARTEHRKFADIFSRSLFITIICDGATDSSHLESEIFYVRLCSQDVIVIDFAGVKNIPKADANGITLGMEHVLQTCLEDDDKKSWTQKVIAMGSDGLHDGRYTMSQERYIDAILE